MAEAKRKPRGAMVCVPCENCKKNFTAREADRKRGWGRYCSKSCKANHRTTTLNPPKDSEHP